VFSGFLCDCLCSTPFFLLTAFLHPKACSFCWDTERFVLRLRQRGDAQRAAELEAMLEEHRTLQLLERQVYYSDRAAAARLDSNSDCIIVDFTHPFPLPYLCQRTETRDHVVKMLVGFGALLDHGPVKRGGGTYFYLNLGCGEHDDANAVCSLLFHYLERKHHAGNLRAGVTLNLQMDSGSSNKNWVMICFLAWIQVCNVLFSVVAAFTFILLRRAIAWAPSTRRF
jgi:hypothetical protein